jgi:4-amino-4-deoxy-L-arabinose transferase-like glycosyltransferase
MTTRTQQLIIPLNLLLLAAVVRLYGFADFAVWTDEGFTVWVIEDRALFMERIMEDRHPPLYFAFLAVWEDIAGLSRLSLRLPSVFTGLLTVALTWRIGLRVGGCVVAVVASLLVAVTPSIVYYTQEIRHFGPLLLTITMSSWLFLRALHRPTILRLTLYAVTVATIMYTLYIGFFIIIAQVFVVLFMWRHPLLDKVRFIGAWFLALGLFSPWLYVFLTQQIGLVGVGIAGVGNVTGFDPGALWRLMSDTAGHGLALLLPLWGLGLWAVLSNHTTGGTIPTNTRPPWSYIALWGVGMFVIMALINPWFTLFRVRTIIMLLPGLAILAGLGFVQLPRRVGITVLAVLLAFTVYREQPIQPRGAMPLLAQAMAEDFRPDDLIVVETGWSDDEFIYEIRYELGWDINIIRTLQWVDGRGEDKLVVLEIEDQLRAAERIWVIHWNQPPSVVPWLQGNSDLYAEVSYTRHTVGPEVEAYMDGLFARIDGDYRLYLFENQNPTPPPTG